MIAGEILSRIWIPAVAYLMGSIPFGYLIAMAGANRDIRSAGSGNIGAANVSRVIGVWAGVATLVLDASKGFLAVWLAARFTGEDAAWMMLAALAVIAGHVFPLWLKFRGGRGVATGAGVFLMISPAAVVAALALWVIIVLIWRYVSLGSIVAAASLPLLVHLLYAPGHTPSRTVSVGTALAAVLIILKHKPNIERLIAGTENRLKFRR